MVGRPGLPLALGTLFPREAARIPPGRERPSFLGFQRTFRPGSSRMLGARRGRDPVSRVTAQGAEAGRGRSPRVALLEWGLGGGPGCSWGPAVLGGRAGLCVPVFHREYLWQKSRGRSTACGAPSYSAGSPPHSCGALAEATGRTAGNTDTRNGR